MHNDFFRAMAISPRVAVADPAANSAAILEALEKASHLQPDLVVFPEMSITAYTCGDLFHNTALLDASEYALRRLVEECPADLPLVLLGMPVRIGIAIYNCAVAITRGKILGAVPKTFLPNYNEFYERRWFAPARDVNATVMLAGHEVNVRADQLFCVGDVKVGVEICEDLWVPMPPSTALAMAGADVIANLSASDDVIGKRAYLRDLVVQQSARCVCAYVYSSAGFGESSTDLVFDAKCYIAENGHMLAQAQSYGIEPKQTVADIDIDALRRDRRHLTTFADCAATSTFCPVEVKCPVPAVRDYQPENIMRAVNPTPFVPDDPTRLAERCAEILHIQAAGLAKRLHATGTRRLVVGISGGLDSTLALLVAVKAFDMLEIDRSGIIGITMPGFGTTHRTRSNAHGLMESLGVEIREISIEQAVRQHFADIGHDPTVTDITYENSQARERTQILMDVANRVGGMVLGTGDLSELALGWATYNGDHMSMYAVNAGVPKTLVRHLVAYIASEMSDGAGRRALLDIIDTPISPELIPATADGEIAQKTEDLVGPYELHDFFLYRMLRHGEAPDRIYLLARKAFQGRYDDRTISRWLKTFVRRFFAQQFKRSCLPDGPKVGSVTLSPRGDWRMPSDASAAAWLSYCDTLL